MLSVRLNEDVADTVEFVSQTSGLSKNQIVVAALLQYLKGVDLGSVPLAEQVAEAGHTTYAKLQEKRSEECKKAIQTAEWARTLGIWTAKPKDGSGRPNGAIYGRNVVIGYTWIGDEIHVLSKHMPAVPYVGADAHSFNVMPYGQWVDVMHEVSRSRPS
ncbi:UNVERIFIED_ORG: hypothetical protein FHT06_001031 [Xanthomonas campestris]